MSAYHAERFLLLLLGASLKASLVFALVFAAARLMQDSLPRLRHLLWFGAICSYLLILLVSLFSPPLLPIPGTAAVSPDGFYETVSSVLVPQGGVGLFSIRAAPALALGKAAPGELLWVLGVLLLWIAGVLACSLRVTVGSVRLHLLLVEARRRGAQGHTGRGERILSGMMAAAGIKRRVRILESQACGVPFACGVLHPIIMLPSSAPRWPQPRLRAVLLHELHHVGRWDFLTQAIARGICSLFWFVPLVWIAYAFLYAEQEKACDAGVVEDGVTPSDYAACILDAARLSPQPAPAAGLYSPAWRKRILADRIRYVLHGGRTAKKRLLIFALTGFVICALAVLGGMGGRAPLTNEEAYKRFVGTWVNTEYPGRSFVRSQVTLIRPDYGGQDWLLLDSFLASKQADGQSNFKVKKTWVDQEERTYCQVFFSYFKGWDMFGVFLMRVDKAGKVLEFTSRGRVNEGATDKYPEKILQGAQSHTIYYRK